jgi:hypothetical protein
MMSDNQDRGYQAGQRMFSPKARAVMIWRVFIRWVLALIAVPLAVAGVRRLSDALEARRGSSRTTWFLRRSAETTENLFGRRKRRRRWPRSA